jgi:hypothetical protein
LIVRGSFGTLCRSLRKPYELAMTRFILKTFAAAAFLLSITGAGNAHPIVIGDEPFWPGTYAYEPVLNQPGCLSWNWQQYAWYNNCPVYVRPTAILFHGRRAVLRTKG